MRRKKSLQVILIAALVMPLLLSAAWLSDKSGTSGNSSGNRNTHGYLYPSIQITDNNFPVISLISAQYDTGSRAVQISWQDSSIKKQDLPSTSVSAFGPRISWDTQGKAEFRYAIYRSTEIISTLQVFYRAQKIGVVYAGVRKYRDTEAKSGKYYYAVSVLDKGDTEYFKPSYDQSYTSEPVIIAEKPNPVSGLMASYNSTENTVHLKWSHDKPAATRYRVYVSQNRITDPSSIGILQMLGTVQSGQTSFSYKPMQNGSYYYAVIPVSSKGLYNNSLSPANSLSSPLLVSRPSTGGGMPAMITGLKAGYDLLTRTMDVRWQYQSPERPGLRVYMNHRSMISNALLLQKSMLIKDFKPGTSLTNFKIAAAGAGNYYLAIISYNISGVFNNKLIPDWNITSAPVVVPGLKTTTVTNYVTATNYLYITNITPVFVTNYKLITKETLKPLTNSYTNYFTNVITVTNAAYTNAAGTNSVFMTNMITVTNMMTNVIEMTNTMTNLIEMTNTVTNMVDVTNMITNTLDMTNYITNVINITNGMTNLINITNTFTNTVTATNWLDITNVRTLTNTATVTNSIDITNYRFKTLFLTNRVIIKETRPGNGNNTGYRPPTRHTQPRDTGYRDRVTLRRTVRSFFRNKARRNRGGMWGNIRQLRRIMNSTTDQSVRNQCLLFIGRAYYNLGQYLTAFRNFVRLKKTLPDESRFWIRRCVSRMR